jgi:hypothetical protein
VKTDSTSGILNIEHIEHIEHSEHDHNHSKDIKYLQLEQPVLVIDLEHTNDSVHSNLLPSIGKIVRQIASIGIHNVVLKSNDVQMIREFIKETEDVKNVNFNIRMGLQNARSFFIKEVKLHSKYSISCTINEVNEIVKHVGEIPQNVPVVLTATNDNNKYLMDNLKAITDEIPNILIISAQLEMGGNCNGITWQNLDVLYCNVIDLIREVPNKKILMDYGILPTRLLTEHPCNGYVCSHGTCHSLKNNLPRRLYINRAGNVIPEHLDMKPQYYLGNILEKDLISIMDEYKDSAKHENFLVLAKKVYTKWVQVCPYRVIHLSDLMMNMS